MHGQPNLKIYSVVFKPTEYFDGCWTVSFLLEVAALTIV
jgi:hypothetical protein